MIGDPLLTSTPEASSDFGDEELHVIEKQPEGSMLSRVPWEAIQLGFAISSLVTILVAFRNNDFEEPKSALNSVALTMGQLGISGLAGVVAKKF